MCVCADGWLHGGEEGLRAHNWMRTMQEIAFVNVAFRLTTLLVRVPFVVQFCINRDTLQFFISNEWLKKIYPTCVSSKCSN